MKLHKGEAIGLVLLALSFSVALYFYPLMPERVASHWNARGQVDGYMNRFWGTFIFPIIFCILFLVFLIVPKIDPKKENIEKFRRYFDGFIISLFVFLFYLYLLTIFWNLGYEFDLIYFMIPALTVFLYMTGVLVAKSEPNWTIGIRTPWTLSSEAVWKKTHALGGKLFKAAAIISLVGLIFPKAAFLIFIIPVLGSAVYVIIYSYFEYKKEGGK